MKEQINSVGIDIGTSTTQLVFSRLTMENLASAYAVPRISITGREILYRSEIYFTPLLEQMKIDAGAVLEIVKNEYAKAQLTPEDLQTGAVIITGESARADNADEVLKKLSSMAGDFVVATAGPSLESVLSARGAGTDKLSEEVAKSIVNLDIGGGTSNLAVYKNGKLMDTACLDIGGRLIKILDGKLAYIYTKLQILAQRQGINIKVGDSADEAVLYKLCTAMAEELTEAIQLKPQSDSHRELYTNGGAPLKTQPIDALTVSGGVADFVYNPSMDEPFRYGDIGVMLGHAIAKKFAEYSAVIYNSQETIRATVVGAGAHTTQVTGSTISYVESVLPIKNLAVLRIDGVEILREIEQSRQIMHETGQMAIALDARDRTSFKDISELGRHLCTALKQEIEAKKPLIIVLEADIAKALGNAIYAEIAESTAVICIDSIVAHSGDYIDIGKALHGGKILPVVVKTLIFNT